MRRPAPRLLGVAAATLLLAGCGGPGVPGSPAAARSTPASSAPAPPQASASPSPKGVPIVQQPPTIGTPEAARTALRRAVTPGNPSLVPGHVPPGMSATVDVSNFGYLVTYTDDLHTKQIGLGDDVGQNPPPMGAAGQSSVRQFRGARADYVVYDATAPMSRRHLTWLEPGDWGRLPGGAQSNEYIMSASGLTDAEFFQVADSLGPA
jgi:hypothetical protein